MGRAVYFPESKDFVLTNLRNSLILLFLLSGFSASAQELNVQVTIDRKQITNVAIDWLEQAIPLIGGFMNDYRWTDQKYEEVERIQAQVHLIFSSIDGASNAAAQLVLTTQRPVYGTTTQTQVLNLADDAAAFNFPRNRILLHDEQSYDPLGSIMNFYALLILGFDADSFSPLGGTPFFERALQISNVASSSGIGWGRDGRRKNRTYTVEFLLDPQYQALRKASYTYHREGLDLFTKDPAAARRNIFAALKAIRENQKKTTEQYPFALFFNTKFREIVRVFEDGDPGLRAEAYQLLSELDPSHLNEYNKLR